MKKDLSNIPLVSNLPSIDLHGENRESTEVLVKQFINDLCKLKCNSGVIIHGIGTGVVKKKVHEVLKKDKRVINYYINFLNPGCTIVELKDLKNIKY